MEINYDPNNTDPSKGPFPMAETTAHKYGNLPKYWPSTEMSLAHNVLIRSLNAIYLQCTSLSNPTDIKDFLVYCQCWYECVHHHHASEETFFFPELERVLDKPGFTTSNVEQHKAFHDKLDEWGKRTYDMQPEEFDGQQWRKMIEDFATPLLTHLHDEIVGLEELCQSLDEKGTETLRDLWKRYSDKMVAETNKSRIMPLVFGAWDRNFEDGINKFPDAPAILNYVVDWVFAWKYRGAWRFSPSDMHSNPRPLKIAEGS